jgi:hypothetical protein
MQKLCVVNIDNNLCLLLLDRYLTYKFEKLLSKQQAKRKMPSSQRYTP